MSTQQYSQYIYRNGNWLLLGGGADSGNTTYTLSQDTQDGHKITLTPSIGDPMTVTIPDNNTTYTGSDGVSLTGTVFKNSGVRSVAQGTANGTISVNTNGTTADVAVKGLAALAYKSSLTASEVGAIATSAKGAASGVAELDSNGKVPTSQLPGFVDDVVEGYYYNSKWYSDSSHTTEVTGEAGKIYVDLSTNKTYRYSGSAFVEISASLALGETSSTAYRGDRGKTAYDHSQSTHARTDATAVASSSTNGNIKINGTETTVYTHPAYTAATAAAKKVGLDATGHVVVGDALTKSDVGLGNVGNFKAVSTAASQGLTSTEQSNARANIGAGTSNLTIGTTATTAAAGNHTHDLSIATDSGTSQITLAASTKYKITAGGSTYVFTTPPNTTYSSKTAASGGTEVSLVTTGEKYTWNNKSDLTIGTTATTAAAGNHTHTTTLATDTGTSSITLAHGGKYKITAGGTSVVFTMPSDNNTTYTFATGDNNGQIKVTPSGGSAQNVSVKGLGSLAYLSSLNASDVGAIATTAKGAANGVAELDGDGKVPTSQLPSYVDDVLEYADQSSFPATGETGKIYIALDTNKTYRWSGSAYVEISASLALGTTSSTAYRGDRGNTAYTHATDANRLTTATTSGLYKVASTAQGHIASLTAITKDDITALGIPGENTTYSDVTTSTHGLMIADDKLKLNYTNVAYATCSTDAATAAKTATLSGNTKWALQAGSIVVVKFTNTNTANNPTLSVGGTTAKSIVYNTSVITTSSLNRAGYANRYITYMFDGTNYVFIGWSIDSDTTYSEASLGQGYGTCATAAATTEKAVTLSSYSLVTGGIVSVKFTYDVPANATMNINSKGAKSIYNKGAAIAAGVIKAGDVATFIYSGQYHLIAIDRWQKGIASISRSGTTFTATYLDGTTSTFDQQDNNTTYTFATGSTNGAFSVTPSGGTAQSVSIKGLAGAAYKAVDTSISAGSTSTNVPTSAAVASLISSALTWKTV